MLAARVLRVAIPALFFAAGSFAVIAQLGITGFDAWLYREGSGALVSGADPWAVGTPVAHYSGSPLTLLAFLPTLLVPEAIWPAIGVAICAAFALYVCRGRPIWLLYPPIVMSVAAGNPQVVVLVLLLARRPAATAFAIAVKGFALVPASGEGLWRGVMLAVAAVVVTALLLPNLWLSYITQLPAIAQRLSMEVGYSGLLYKAPWLLPFAAVAVAYIATRDRRAAGWLAIPVLWPAWEYTYLMMLIPVVGPWLGLLAVVLPGQTGAAAVAIVYAVRLAMKAHDRQVPALIGQPVAVSPPS